MASCCKNYCCKHCNSIKRRRRWRPLSQLTLIATVIFFISSSHLASLCSATEQLHGPGEILAADAHADTDAESFTEVQEKPASSTSDWCFVKDPAIDLRRTCKYVKDTATKSIRLTCLQEFVKRPAAADCSNLFVNTSLLINRICVLTYELDKYKQLEDLMFEGIDFTGCNQVNKLQVNIAISNVADMEPPQRGSAAAAAAAPVLSLFGAKDEPRLIVSEFNATQSVISEEPNDNLFNLYEVLRFYSDKIQKSVHLERVDSSGRNLVEDSFKFDQPGVEFTLRNAKFKHIAKNAIRMDHPKLISLQDVEVERFSAGPVMNLTWMDCQRVTNHQNRDGYHTNISISSSLTSSNLDGANLIEVNTDGGCQVRPRVNFNLENNNLQGLLSREIFGDLFTKHASKIDIAFRFEPIYCCADSNSWFMELVYSSKPTKSSINLANINMTCSDTTRTIQAYNESRVYQEDCDKVSRWSGFLIAAGFISAILILLVVTTGVCMFFIIPKTRGTILSIKSHIPSSNASESTDLGSSILEITSEQPPSAQRSKLKQPTGIISNNAKNNDSQTTLVPIVKMPATKGKRVTSKITTSKSSSPTSTIHHKRKSSSAMDLGKVVGGGGGGQGAGKKRKTQHTSRTSSKTSLGFRRSSGSNIRPVK